MTIEAEDGLSVRDRLLPRGANDGPRIRRFLERLGKTRALRGCHNQDVAKIGQAELEVEGREFSDHLSIKRQVLAEIRSKLRINPFQFQFLAEAVEGEIEVRPVEVILGRQVKSWFLEYRLETLPLILISCKDLPSDLRASCSDQSGRPDCFPIALFGFGLSEEDNLSIGSFRIARSSAGYSYLTHPDSPDGRIRIGELSRNNYSFLKSYLALFLSPGAPIKPFEVLLVHSLTPP